MRSYSFIDQIIQHVDTGLRALSPQSMSARANPAADIHETLMNSEDKNKSIGLMRVNHVGEVCAQALYQGQAITARDKEIKIKLQNSAQEEQDHLAWCETRIHELNGHTSYLNPLWYGASLLIGLVAGFAGDKISLGFLAETEHQVEQHLSDHLQRLPVNDAKSRAIVEQMRSEEIQHATLAEQSGAVDLPFPIKTLMRCFSKVMTTTAYWV